MMSPLRGTGRQIFLQTFAVLIVAVLALKFCAQRPSATIATFNIEEFPKSEAQVDGAFRTLRGLSADVVALQEITEPERFRRETTRRLDGRWRALFPDVSPEMSPGVLFDAQRYELVDTHTHEDTVLYDGARPVFEVELVDRRGGELEFFVVHFKAGSDGLQVRRDQHRALRAILRRHGDSERTTILLGDFNSTEPADRTLVETTAERASLRWLSRRTECTGYWVPDGRCRSFDLDHVLADGLGGAAVSRGPCESVGCEPGDSCPVFHRRVSDHCPVTTELVPD